jgi:hypothetical protein
LDYLKEFFDTLPEHKQWDHAIDLGFQLSPRNKVRWSQSEFDNIKDRVQTAHGSEEFQTIGTVTNLLDYFERTQTMMRQFF